MFDMCEAVDAVHRVKPAQSKCAWCSGPLGPFVPDHIMALLHAWATVLPGYQPPAPSVTWWRPLSAGTGSCVPLHIGCRPKAVAAHNALLPKGVSSNE